MVEKARPLFLRRPSGLGSGLCSGAREMSVLKKMVIIDSMNYFVKIRAPNIRRFLREGGKNFRQVFETYLGSQTVSKTPWK